MLPLLSVHLRRLRCNLMHYGFPCRRMVPSRCGSPLTPSGASRFLRPSHKSFPPTSLPPCRSFLQSGNSSGIRRSYCPLQSRLPLYSSTRSHIPYADNMPPDRKLAHTRYCFSVRRDPPFSVPAPESYRSAVQENRLLQKKNSSRPL